MQKNKMFFHTSKSISLSLITTKTLAYKHYNLNTKPEMISLDLLNGTKITIYKM